MRAHVGAATDLAVAAPDASDETAPSEGVGLASAVVDDPGAAPAVPSVVAVAAGDAGVAGPQPATALASATTNGRR
jgi:hypothetical protein